MLDWATIRHFRAHEWGDWPRVDPRLIYALDDLRDLLGKPIVIHEAYANGGHAEHSEHYRGMAADCHAEGVELVDFFLCASRFAIFRGIGLYPYWRQRGLHLDIREAPHRAYWWRDADGRYKSLTSRVLAEFA